MTNIDCNELSDVELGAVSGGVYSFWPSAPSKQTVEAISTVTAVVATAAVGSMNVAGEAFVGACLWSYNAGRSDK